VVSRPGPWTKSAEWCATLLQMTPLVRGNASEPRTLVMRPRSTVTVKLHVSGQSRVQTAGCSRVVIGGPAHRRSNSDPHITQSVSLGTSRPFFSWLYRTGSHQGGTPSRSRVHDVWHGSYWCVGLTYTKADLSPNPIGDCARVADHVHLYEKQRLLTYHFASYVNLLCKLDDATSISYERCTHRIREISCRQAGRPLRSAISASYSASVLGP